MLSDTNISPKKGSYFHGLEAGLSWECTDLHMPQGLHSALLTCRLGFDQVSLHGQACICPDDRWMIRPQEAWMSSLWLSFCNHLTLWHSTEKLNNPEKENKNQTKQHPQGEISLLLQSLKPNSCYLPWWTTNKSGQGTFRGKNNNSHPNGKNQWLGSHGSAYLLCFHYYSLINCESSLIFFSSKIKFKMESNRCQQAVLGFR